jgi:hypothetical protein
VNFTMASPILIIAQPGTGRTNCQAESGGSGMEFQSLVETSGRICRPPRMLNRTVTDPKSAREEARVSFLVELSVDPICSLETIRRLTVCDETCSSVRSWLRVVSYKSCLVVRRCGDAVK